MTTTFETARIGDKVWSIERGWGEIQTLTDDVKYPIKVAFPNDFPLCYTLDGKQLITHQLRTLFWGEVEIDAPTKPLPELEVDTKVIVWSDPDQKHNRHFSHFENDQMFTFNDGRTSFSRRYAYAVTGWSNWELVE